MSQSIKLVKRRRRARRAESAFVSKSISLPVEVARNVEKTADLDYGGNESALFTEAVERLLGIERKPEPIRT